MNGTAPPVVFDFNTWIGLFPEFGALTPGQGAAYFMRATGSFVGNQTSNPAFCDGRLPYLCYLGTSHVAWLSCPKDANGNPAATGTPASPLVGTINSAAEGSVNVGLEFNIGQDTGALQAYLSQTKYGVEYLAAIATYRTARYLARPTIVVPGGLFPGLPLPPGW